MLVGRREYQMKGLIVSLHSTTRVPVDDQYAALVGKAIYLFAYYEWTIIWIIEYLAPGFVGDYCRGKPLPSGGVKKRLDELTNDPTTDFSKVSSNELAECGNIFQALVI